MNNYSEQKNEIKKLFPEKLNFSVSKGKRKDQQRIYAKTKRHRKNIFIKWALNKNDEFYLHERNAYLSDTIEKFAPKLIQPLSQGNVFSLIDGQTLDEIFSKQLTIQLAKQAIKKMAHFHNFSKEVTIDKEIKLTLRKNNLRSELYHAGAMHGDLDPFNTILSKKELYFIDWEDYRENGLCEIDFVHFIAMLWIITNKNANVTLNSKAKKIIEDVFVLNKFKVLFDEYSSITGTKRSALLRLFPAYCDLSISRLKRNKRQWKNFIYVELKKESKKWLRKNMLEI